MIRSSAPDPTPMWMLEMPPTDAASAATAVGASASGVRVVGVDGAGVTMGDLLDRLDVAVGALQDVDVDALGDDGVGQVLAAAERQSRRLRSLRARLAGVLTALGLSVMASLWTLAALLGLNAVFALFPWAYLGLRIFGAAYLVWLAIGTWRGARDPVTPGAPVPLRRGRAFLSGFLFFNPPTS